MGDSSHTNKLGDVRLIQTCGTDREPCDECSHQSTTQRHGRQTRAPACEGRGSPWTFALRPLTRRLVDLDPGVGDIVQAPISVLLEAATQKNPNVRRGGRRQGVPVRLVLEDISNGVGYRLAGESRMTGGRLVDHAAERPDVRALVERLATRLLRAHVGRCAQDDSLASVCCGERGERAGSAPGDSSVNALARPKSNTFTLPSEVTLTLAGF